MAKIRLLSVYGDGTSLGLDMKLNGHEVDYWIKEPKFRDRFNGIVPQVKEWNAKLSKDTAYIADMTGNGKVIQKLRDSGYKTWSGGDINDKLEDDRLYAYEVAEKAGLLVPEYEHFTSFDKAIKFIEATDDEDSYVFKPCSIKASASWTYMAKDKEDMLKMLPYYEKEWSKNIGDGVDFILQKKVEGSQVCIESWYCNGTRVPNFAHVQIETKKFCHGDTGPSTGCEATLARFVDDDNVLMQELKKLDRFAKEHKLNSPFDINAIVNNDGEIYFLEFTPRMGYSSTFVVMQTLKNSGIDIGSLLYSLASGNPISIKPKKDLCGCVKVSIPPYPNEHGCEFSKGKPIDIAEIDSIWLQDVMLEDDCLVCAGTYCPIAEVTAMGTIEQIEKDIYAKIDKLNIPEKMMRQDGIKVLKKRWSELEDWGYV